MYASDITHKKRAEAIYRNLQLQKEWFASGGTIRILGQKGGNDYAYMTEVQEGCIIDKCWQNLIPINPSLGNGPIDGNVTNFTQTDFTGITDFGNDISISGVLDDGNVLISSGGNDFYFFGTNYGATNNMYWNTNNVITFGTGFLGSTVSFSANTIPAILLGNLDRQTSGFYSINYISASNKYSITKLIVYFCNYYTDTTNLDKGKMQIRIIRELVGENRQWVEVGIISDVAEPGYSNNPTVSYQSGNNPVSGLPQDSNGNPIDPTKNSPWDVTNGTTFMNVAGTTYSTAFPTAGTTILYQSDNKGYNWKFTPNAYLNV